MCNATTDTDAASADGIVTRLQNYLNNEMIICATGDVRLAEIFGRRLQLRSGLILDDAIMSVAIDRTA